VAGQIQKGQVKRVQPFSNMLEGLFLFYVQCGRHPKPARREFFLISIWFFGNDAGWTFSGLMVEI
jgi:hypothetical protein